MNIFVSDYIRSFDPNRQRRASAILDGLKAEKSDLSLVATRLSKFGLNPTLVIGDEQPNVPVSSSKNSVTFRDIATRMSILYSESSYISLLLDGFGSALLEDIGTIEGEISALEKALNNYGFLLSDGGSFDYAYLESFNDERNRDSFEFEITDRSSLVFSQSQEAVVDIQEGTLGISNAVEVGYPIHGQIVSSNADGSETSDTGIENATNGDIKTGWRVAIDTSRALQHAIPAFKGLYGQQDWIGAQYVVEFTLDTPSPADVIRISPFTDFPFELTQLELFPSHEEANSTKILAEPRTLEKLTSIDFPFQVVQRVRLYLRQPTFQDAGTLTVYPPEQQMRPILSHVNNIYTPPPPPTPPKVIHHSRLVQRPDAPLYELVRGWPDKPKKLHPTRHPNNYKQDLINYRLGKEALWQGVLAQTAGKPIADLYKLFTPASQKTLDHLKHFFLESTLRIPSHINRPQKDIDRYNSSRVRFLASNFDIIPLPLVFEEWDEVIPVDTTPVPAPIASPIKYQPLDPTVYKLRKYNLGLQFVKVGIAAKGNKGVFVTKPFPAPGDMGEVKIKVGETNYSTTNTDKDMPLLTFVEYSVTNKSNPTHEEDWVPILPIDKTDSIQELLLPDDTGKSLFRFPADGAKSVILYKNGYRSDIPISDILIKSNDQQQILGINIPAGYVSSTDNIICEYTPTTEANLVNFQKAGFDLPPLVSSYDNSGPGESFFGTNGDLTVNLQFSPYINYDQVDASEYDEDKGLNPYAPIVISLSDGTVPINLTNYKDGEQAALDSNSSEYQYIHNNNILLFNKPITQSFKVYYQYLPSNVRLRVILRSATGSFIGPKVDWVQIKGKTRKADSKRA